jgi:hypothetical protein
MKTVQLSKLGTLAEELRDGETIEVLDGDKRIAIIEPVMPKDARVQEALRTGFLTRASDEGLPSWFFDEPPVKVDDSGVNQVLLDREKNDW